MILSVAYLNLPNLISIVLAILTSVFSLQYLGFTFDDPQNIDENDWKRKWILFFAWLSVIVGGLVVIASAFLLAPVLVLPIMTCILIIIYLGPTFEVPENIDPTDWKRKWIVFFSWFNLALSSLSIIIALSMMAIMPIILAQHPPIHRSYEFRRID